MVAVKRRKEKEPKQIQKRFYTKRLSEISIALLALSATINLAARQTASQIYESDSFARHD